MTSFTDLPTLTGDRVVLEPLSHDREEELARAVAVDDLWKTWYTSIPAPDTMAAEIATRLANHARGTMMPFGVVDRASGFAVGMTTFMNLQPAHRRLEIGSTWLGRAAQRSGINTEAKLLLLAHAFEALDCIAVEFRTHWHNRQSRDAIAGLGAKQDGVLRSHMVMPDGTLRDTVVFSIVASEWPTVRRGLVARLDAHRRS